MRWWATLLWCVLAAAAVAAVLRLGADPAGAGRGAGSGSGSASGFGRATEAPLVGESLTDLDRVEEIRVSRRGERPMRLLRQGRSWVEVEPSGLPADPFAVRELLAAVRSLIPTRWISLSQEDGENLRHSLELEPPEATVVLRGSDDSVLLRLGRLGLAGRAFVQPVDPQSPAALPGREDVAVVGQELHTILLRQEPGAWLLRTLFPDAGIETTRLEYTASGSTLRLRREGGRWRMEAPVATRVDAEALGVYLAGLSRAECAGFVGDAETPEELEELEELEKHGLAAPVATLSIETGEGASAVTRTLRIGRLMVVGGGDRFGMLDGHPVLLSLSPATLQSLFASPAALIDPTTCGVLPADVKRINIKGPDGEFVVERDLDRWRASDAAGVELVPAPQSRAIEEFLRRLTAARASSVSLRPIPPEMLIGSIELIAFDGRMLAAIDVSSDSTGAHFAFDAGDGVARIFPASMAPGLTREALGLAPP